jgi:hypothetical protein
MLAEIRSECAMIVFIDGHIGCGVSSIQKRRKRDGWPKEAQSLSGRPQTQPL